MTFFNIIQEHKKITDNFLSVIYGSSCCFRLIETTRVTPDITMFYKNYSLCVQQ